MGSGGYFLGSGGHFTGNGGHFVGSGGHFVGSGGHFAGSGGHFVGSGGHFMSGCARIDAWRTSMETTLAAPQRAPPVLEQVVWSGRRGSDDEK